jgi:hypothetical protein
VLKYDGSNLFEIIGMIKKLFIDNHQDWVLNEDIEEVFSTDPSQELRIWIQWRMEMFSVARGLILYRLPTDLHRWFDEPISPKAMIKLIKGAFVPEIRKMEFDCLREFTSIRMEEGDDLEEHLAKMDRYYDRLSEIMDDRFYDNLPMNILIGSLPRSYKGLTQAILRYNDSPSYREVMDTLRESKIDPLGGELLDEIMDE